MNWHSKYLPIKNPITAEMDMNGRGCVLACGCASACHALWHSIVYDYICRNPIFACIRRCALPLAWKTESNFSPLALTHTACFRRTEWIFDLTNQQRIDLNLFLSALIWPHVLAFWRSKPVVAKRKHLQKRSSLYVCMSPRLYACLNARVCNYQDFEWFLYYISNPSPLRGWQIQFTATEDSLCLCQFLVWNVLSVQ